MLVLWRNDDTGDWRIRQNYEQLYQMINMIEKLKKKVSSEPGLP